MSRFARVALPVLGLALVAASTVGCGSGPETSGLSDQVYQDSKGELHVKPQLFQDIAPLEPKPPEEAAPAPAPGAAGTTPAAGGTAPAGGAAPAPAAPAAPAPAAPAPTAPAPPAGAAK